MSEPTTGFAKPGAATTTIDVASLEPNTPPPAAATPAAPAPAYNPLAVTGTTPGAVALPPPPRPVLMDDNAISFKDINLSGINIVQGVGDLNAKFDAGQLILGQEIQLCAQPSKKEKNALSTPAVSMIVLGFRPNRFAEKVKRQEGETGGGQGRCFDTEAQVYAVGGTLVYKEAFVDKVQVKSYFQTLATALVLVKAPPTDSEFAIVGDELDSLFPLIDDEGGHWQIAQWNMKGRAYTDGAKELMTMRRLGVLKLGYTTKIQLAYTHYVLSGANWIYAPVFRNGGDTSPAQRKFAAEVMEELFGRVPKAPEPTPAVPLAAEAVASTEPQDDGL